MTENEGYAVLGRTISGTIQNRELSESAGAFVEGMCEMFTALKITGVFSNSNRLSWHNAKESAPRKSMFGLVVQQYNKGNRSAWFCYWNQGAECWIDYNDGREIDNPVYWMEIPSIPMH